MRVVIPARGYSDFLQVTLPAWRGFLPQANILVVCGHREALPDIDAAADTCFLATDAWEKDGAELNKAAALEQGFEGTSPGELCIAADADVVPHGSLPEVKDDTLYGCPRYLCPDPGTLNRVQAGEVLREELTLIPPRRKGNEPAYGTVTAQQAAEACTGYFQMFRYRHGLTFGSYPTAAGYDSAFRRQFTRRVGLTDFYVLHLGELSRENWKGRVVPRWPSEVRA